MSLAEVAKQLDWYSEDKILNPSGYGAKVYAELVKKKIAGTLKNEKKIEDVKVGVLVNDPTSDKTQTPIAIVCEFQSEIDIETLNLTHKLAWNFCRSPLLIIIEPRRVRALSCYIEPEKSESKTTIKSQLPFEQSLRQEITHKAEIFQFPIDKTHAAHQAAESLRWIELYSGQFFREQEKRGYFPTKQRVDYMLLENLKFIRKELIALKLDEDIVHDLLARIIFIQFLFQRKDSKGKPAIDNKFLEARHKDGTLSKEYKKLEEILENKTDTYSFFKWLNRKFNGDLFPGRSKTDEESEAEWKQEMEKVWKQEMEKVKPTHLKKLARFISGKEKMKDGQLCLWERYSFDVIPLEFISSIYEVFVDKDNGTHYTPSHLVDFVLDTHNVLPWSGANWDLKILDPACGSGIFLVKAFQRLVQRWKNVNPDKQPDESFLAGLLTNNIFGVDINPHAVRVASFSLYLAMCDEIDPRRYWQKWEFPPMRGKQIVKKDFFERHPLFPHRTEQMEYDLIIGNAPWGKGSASKSSHAQKWAETKDDEWKIPYEDIGPLFLPKSASMTKLSGTVALIQPVNSLLFNQSSNCIAFRQKLFTSYKISKIVNLSVLRFGLFSDSISPSCIVVLINTPPDEKPISYVCPKSTKTKEDTEQIFIEPQDRSYVYPTEALNNPLVWTTLMWGGRRDLSLMRRLRQQESLQKLMDKGILDEKKDKRRGTERGKNPTKRQDTIIGRRFLCEKKFPEKAFLILDSKLLQINKDPWTYERDSTTYDAFELPQLLLKLGWQTDIERFRAVLVKSDDGKGVLCSHSYVSVHSKHSSILESACLSFNSKLAVYFLMLSSGQFATYRPKITVEEALSVPITETRQNLLKGIKTFEELDNRVYELFSLKDSEKILIEDLFDYTLPDFKGNIDSKSRQKTERKNEFENELDLTAYCDIFRRVIKAGFGKETTICTTIFQEDENTSLSPMRMIKIDLDVFHKDENKIEPTSYESLWKRLESFEKIFNHRVYRCYEPRQEGVGITLYLVKPDQKRYWLRSQAYRDADEVCAEILMAVNKSYLNSLPNLKKEKKVA